MGSAGGRCHHSAPYLLAREPAGKNMFKNSCPSGQGIFPRHSDVYLPAKTGSLGSKSCTSLHRSTVEHPCWSWLAAVSPPSDQISVEDSLPGLRPYSAGWQQVVRHRRHSAGLRVSSQCTACLWRREHEAGRPHLPPHSGSRKALTFGNVLNVCLVRESMLQPLQQ